MKRPGTTIERRDWCATCDAIVPLTATVLETPPDVFFAATEWWCGRHDGYAI